LPVKISVSRVLIRLWEASTVNRAAGFCPVVVRR
jgi:hypothetical protein